MGQNERIAASANKDLLLALVSDSMELNRTVQTPSFPTRNEFNMAERTHINEGNVDLKLRQISCMSAEEEEKKRISRELHDGLGQLLTSIRIHVQNCMNDCDSSDSRDANQELKESLAAISEMTQQAMGEVRSICSALRPAILDDLGVLAAITWQCRQISSGYSKVSVDTRLDLSESMIPEAYKSVIYRIVQEGLNNAVKYSQTESVKISLYPNNESIELVIRDYGVGFDLDKIRAEQGMGMGMGLMSMRERAESIGGTCEINAAEGRGVEVRASFPIQKVVLSG
jgi:signal transduction histidine kinase